MSDLRRILIVGVPRSGTTLLQSLLAAHPEATSFTESHAFSRHCRPLPLRSAVLLRDPRPRIATFLAENGVEDVEALMASFPRTPRLPSLRTSAFAVGFLRLLDALAARRGVTAWIEKTPMHLHFVPFLERIVAGLSDAALQVVHVVRRGEDVVPSLRRASRQWEVPYDLDACAARWNADMALSVRRARSSDDRFVFYEDLTEAPEDVLRPLCASLGLPWTPSLIEAYAEAAQGLVTPGETWKAGLGGGIRSAQEKGASSELSSDEAARLPSLLRATRYETLRALVNDRGRG